MVNILVISILIIPWLILPFNSVPDQTRLIKAAFFDLTMLSIIVMALKNGLRYEYRNKYLAWLAGLVFASFIFNWYYPIDRGLGYNAGTLDAMIHFTLSIMATILVCSNLERIDFIRCAKAMCISATLISVFCIFQGIGLDPMKKLVSYSWKEPRHIAALLDNPDIVGNYLCMVLPLFLYFRKPKYYLCLGLCVIALLFAQSSLSIIAAFAGVFVYVLFISRKSKINLISLFLVLFIAISYCVTNPAFNKLGNGFTGRLGAWKMMVDRDNNPLFGQGLGSVKDLHVQIGNNYWVFAHNDYLEVYCSLGALGVFLLALVIIHAFKRFNYKQDNEVGFAYYGCFIAFLIVMCGSFPMEMPPLALNGLVFFWAMSKT